MAPSKEEPKPLVSPFEHRTRFLLLILVTACLMINWANILTFNFSIICLHDTNDTSDPNRGIHLDNNAKSEAMAVVAAGALIANLPIVTLINMYGPRYIFTAVGLFGAVATFCIPFALRAGWYWFLFIRVLQGIAFAGDMATFGSFMK